MESFRGAQKVFDATVEAEERHAVIQELIAKGVGVPSVESYHSKQSSACRVSKNQSRNSNSINRDMKSKLKDTK